MKEFSRERIQSWVAENPFLPGGEIVLLERLERNGRGGPHAKRLAGKVRHPMGPTEHTEAWSAISYPATYNERENRVKLISVMARMKTPQQKRQESYAHDRGDGAEYPHADRKNRPRFKTRTKRQLRRSAKQMLASQPEDVLQRQERPKRTWHKTGVPLSEHLIATQKKRVEREAHNIFRKGYGPATHSRFRRVVESWMKGESEHSAALADLYRKLLNPYDEGIQAFFGPEYSYERGYFLSQFFSREPMLKRDFDKWIASLRRPSDRD